jgi:hypothetical protein
MIVPAISSSFVHLYISNEVARMKNMPQIKANLDKNKSQRIGILV